MRCEQRALVFADKERVSHEYTVKNARQQRISPESSTPCAQKLLGSLLTTFCDETKYTMGTIWNNLVSFGNVFMIKHASRNIDIIRELYALCCKAHVSTAFDIL